MGQFSEFLFYRSSPSSELFQTWFSVAAFVCLLGELFIVRNIRDTRHKQKAQVRFNYIMTYEMYCDTDHSIQRLPTTALTEENMQTRAESRVTIPMDSQP